MDAEVTHAELYARVREILLEAVGPLDGVLNEARALVAERDRLLMEVESLNGRLDVYRAHSRPEGDGDA